MTDRRAIRRVLVALATAAAGAATIVATATPAGAAPGPEPSGLLPPELLPGGTLPPITTPPLTSPLPTLEEILGGVGEGTGEVVEGLPLPEVAPAPAPGAAPAPAPAPAPASPAPESAPAPAPGPAAPVPAPEPGGVDGGGERGGEGGSSGDSPAAPSPADGSGDTSFTERLTAAAGSRTNLMLLALGLGVALLGASPRVHTYRRDRREVLGRLSDAYDQQRQAAEELADADRLKGEFLSMVSHELRTPLTAVKGFVDTVLLHWDRFPEDRRRDLLERASGNADDLSRLVDQLVDFARIDANQVNVDPRPLVVEAAVDEVVRDLAPVLEEHPVEVDAPVALVMLADADAFGHVLVNLMTNAAKFSPAGSPIRVRARAERGNIVVSVTDRGIGIAREDHARIFERFYQSAGTGGSRAGTGIGLAIASRFTEVQGGRIWVESEPGEGSTFSFTLPAAPRAARRELTASARAS